MKNIVPCLWFDGDADEAANFYVSLLPDSKIDRTMRSPGDTPGAEEGEVLTVEFTLMGKEYFALNGGPGQPFNESISFQILCENQEEVDSLWEAFTKDGEEIMCGWLKDKWGLRWQIVPIQLMNWLNDSDRERAGRVQDAMHKMVKIDIAALGEAAE